MFYKEYEIEREGNHYRVNAPDGRTWTEDTSKDAKEEIDRIEKK